MIERQDINYREGSQGHVAVKENSGCIGNDSL